MLLRIIEAGREDGGEKRSCSEGGKEKIVTQPDNIHVIGKGMKDGESNEGKKSIWDEG